MKKVSIFTKAFVFMSMLIAGAGFFLVPSAWAQISELRIGIGIDADTLNPQEQTTTLVQNMCDLIYDTLFYQTPEGKLEPRLAAGYKVSKDGLIYTISLRKGVKF
ncbi:MAG: glutathione ABC transporter substrate-binding protein GsiB, partial [Deltaproteobacteria bacterium]|nr:glutathione ABC transporter substrate-binding protein GsiB [Deltaproteobacteria bacterium]